MNFSYLFFNHKTKAANNYFDVHDAIFSKRRKHM